MAKQKTTFQTACAAGALLGLVLLSAANSTSVMAQNNQAQTKTAPVMVAQPSREVHVSPRVLSGIDANRQFRTIGEAATNAAPGDVVTIHSGVYREAVVIEKSGTRERPIRFQTAPNANVLVTGADRLTDWKKEENAGADNIFSTPWDHVFIGGKTMSHPDDDYHKTIGRAEQVFVDDYALHQVLKREHLGRGAFYVDTENKRLYIQSATNTLDLKDARVEASTRSVLWDCRGDYVGLRGVRFRYAANRAQQGAVQWKGRGDTMEDCIIERTNGIGASFTAPNQIVRRCAFEQNGQMGWAAVGAHDLLFTECLTRDNNVKGFSRGWEAGGDKIVLSRGVTIQNSRFISNRGSGVWFDIGNENSTVANCLFADNEDAGIFYEISYGLHAHDNVFVGNGLSDTAGSWGAAAAICLSSSPNCVIERNLMIGNKEGFNFREQNRTTWRVGFKTGDSEVAVWNHDQIIRNNVLAYNRDSQTRGWFDLNDERLWPRAWQAKLGAAPAQDARPAADMAANYGAKDSTTQPVGLSLETLRLTFSNNLYSINEDQSVFDWGVEWKRNEKFKSVAEVQKRLKLEQGSVVAPFVFGDYLTRDFRIPANSLALKMDCYPRGVVPGVQLGVLPSATRRAVQQS